MCADFSKELNPQQLAVVTDNEGPLLVLAGAGSGKTRSIIYRCAWLLKEKQVPPWNILVVTFTNKAARELQERLQNLLGFPVRSLWVGTFHHVCSRILRSEAASLPFGSNFSIYDQDDQASLLKKIYKEHNLDRQKFPIQRVLTRIGRYKNRLLLPEDLSSTHAVDSRGNRWQDDFENGVLRIYGLYQQKLLLNQALDFDDILLYTAKLLQDNSAVRAKYGQMFRYVMIDEYQDTNQAQFEIVYQIAKDHQRVCVVGDDDQAIYSFRGATIRNILEFEQDYSNVRSIRLEQNYRSTTGILDLANAIIRHNRRRHRKDLWSDLGKGEKPQLLNHQNETEEANQTAKMVVRLHAEGVPYGQIAVLYRTNAQSRVFEYAFLQEEIPHAIVGSLHFYQRKEIRDLLAYLAVLSNPSDAESLLRIINEPPRGIGQTTVNRLLAHAAKTRGTLYQALQNSASIEEIGPSLKKKLVEFSEKLDDWRKLAREAPVLDLVKELMDYLDLVNLYKQSKDPKDISRVENLIEFVGSVSEFSERWAEEHDTPPRLDDFLPFVALQTDMDRMDSGADSVRLMTLHNAKGLEFGCVFIVGLEDELLPHRMSLDSHEAIEEERRLFYVGVTRAKTRLFLSYAKCRRLYDTFYYTKPSQFLQELDESLFTGSNDQTDFTPAPRHRPKTRHRITEKDKQFRIGQQVWHSEYGKGMVLSVDGIGSSARLTVSFVSGKLAKIIGTFVSTEPL
ncbi:MAG TPA: UvrD-helicase domain-containing protein [Candidatus Syntrophosphaera sp.]|nr:UvrD-helicase domain-containing protein [Candidatus Syntrophosphaera sp.]